MNETNNPTDGSVVVRQPLLQGPALRRMIAVVTGVSLLVFGLLMRAPAHAQDLGVTVQNLGAGSLSVDITVTGCDDTVGGTYQIWDDANEVVVASTPIPAQDFNWTATYPGGYRIDVECLNYNGSTTLTASASFTVGLIYVSLDPQVWSTGDQVTINATGFIPGSSVTLEMYTDEDKKLVRTWTGTADSAGVLTLTVTWPSTASDGSALPVGDYAILVTAGDRQGDVQFAQMSAGKWGPQMVPGEGENGNKNNGNKNNGNKNGGNNNKGKLPKTGN